jgi:hypothetical protein
MKVYELLAKPEAWLQGGPVIYQGGKEVSWCLMVALDKVYGADASHHTDIIKAKTKSYSIVSWNDAPERTHEEVLALCKELDI